jgi:PAS domain-containing protein
MAVLLVTAMRTLPTTLLGATGRDETYRHVQGKRVQHAVELIVLKQPASYLATPIFVVDPVGTLLYYNEPAELILGRRYDETGEMTLEEWGSIFVPVDDDGVPMPPEAVPLAIAVRERRPAHATFSITGLDGAARRISATAFPLVGQSGRHLGSIAIFWEEPG